MKVSQGKARGRHGARRAKKIEVIETRCDLELPESAGNATLRINLLPSRNVA